MDDNQLKRFSNLFKANGRSYGRWNPNKPKGKDSSTEKAEHGIEHFQAHLEGKMGLGLVPIRDDGMCLWGAIDVDNHGQSEDLDLPGIEKRVRGLNLPLIVCRSKSGGAHLYLFGSEPLRGDHLKTVLTRWMADLNLEGSDAVFPKQAKLAMDGSGNRPLGNWINLPYFNAEATDRYAIENGKPVPFDLFLTNAESGAISQEQLEGFFANEHSEAPPCIQHAMREGIKSGEGMRNEALFHITIYNRKRNPEQAREMTHAMQPQVFTDPLPFGEADKTIRSASRKNYGYLCKKDPWKGWCDREACRKRKYGISESEFEVLIADTKLPMFSNLTKYMNTDPVLWELQMNGVPITFTTEELMDWRMVRQRAVEKLHMMLPSKIKPSQWTDEILAELMGKLTIEEAPMESSPIGVLHIRMEEFLRKSDLTSDGLDPKDRDALLRGMPVVQFHQDARVVMFRSLDYEDYLKRTKTDIPRNKALWHKMNKELGVKFDRVRVKQQLVSVWMFPVDRLSEVKLDPIKVAPEY
jgi:hypothetical protein